MSIHYLYRINGGEVLGMSVVLEAYTNVDPAYVAVVTDPAEPDGRDLQPLKIFDAGTIRNATAPEIANFAVAAADDQKLMDRDAAKALCTDAAVMRSVFRALIHVLIDEINILRRKQKPPLADRTVAQAVAAIKSRIDTGDYD